MMDNMAAGGRLPAALERWVGRILPLDERAMALASARQERLTKPRGSLGRLEELSIRIAGITGDPLPTVRNKVIVVMAGDHGIAAEGVSAYPQEVTAQMVRNFLAGGAAINVLARQVGARVVVVDMGVAAELEAHPALAARKVVRGTRNMTREPAMTREQALLTVEAGAGLVEEEMARGLDILGAGEMGIGNTSAAAATAVALTGLPAARLVGRGTGLDEAGLARKQAAVERALDLLSPDPADAVDLLAKVGGAEIGGLVGAILAAAAQRRPVMIDGFISTAAAMLAVTLAPAARSYLIASHRSQEAGHGLMLEWLGLEPLMALDLRLGEGSGAALGMQLAESACRLLREMATFDEAGVSGREAG